MRTETEIQNAVDKLKIQQSYWRKGSKEYNKYALIINLLQWTLGKKESIYSI